MCEFELPEDSEVYLSCNRGIYIPQIFAKSIRKECLSNVSESDLEILESGPDHEQYWDAWTDVLDNAVLTDSNGKCWYLYQDGDLWIVPKD